MKCKVNVRTHGTVSVAQKTIHEAEKLRQDASIIRLCETLDLIASEAQHHFSCYRNYIQSIVSECSVEKDFTHNIFPEAASGEEAIFQI